MAKITSIRILVVLAVPASFCIHFGVGASVRTKVVPDSPLNLPRRKRRVFTPPNTIREKNFRGQYTLDGGLFESYKDGTCHQQKEASGVCAKPCMEHWPEDEPSGRCIVSDRTGQCICVDPCALMARPKYANFGNEIPGSGCDECVRHKFDQSSISKKRWVIKHSPINCAWCGNACISGDAHGATVLGTDCPDEYDYTLNNCRNTELTVEELHGAQADEPYGSDRENAGESQGENSNIPDNVPEDVGKQLLQDVVQRVQA